MMVKTKTYRVPKGFVPTGSKVGKKKVRIKFTKYKYGIRQKHFAQKTKVKSFIIPKRHKFVKATTIERGLTPSRFKVLFKKRR